MGVGANREGIDFSASKLRRGAKFQCKRLEGGGKIAVHRHLKANLRQQKYTLNIFAATGAADIFQYRTFIFPANFALSLFTYVLFMGTMTTD